MNDAQIFQDYLTAEQALSHIAQQLQEEAGPALFRLRSRGGWTQRELATLLDCDFTTISRIERGHMVPGKPLMLKIVRLATNNPTR